MSQPIWNRLWASDDEQVFVDTTGVYPPEMEVAQEIGDGKWHVHRFPLERLRRVEVTSDGGPDAGKVYVYLVPWKYDAKWPHPVASYDEWFHKDLSSVASSAGTSLEDLRAALCGEDVRARAAAYRDIGGHWGFANLDSYPLELSEAEIERRWE